MEKSDKKTVKSTKLQCGKRTFFFDVNVASNDSKYLKITESRLQEGAEPRRNSIIIFQQDFQNFQKNLNEMMESVVK